MEIFCTIESLRLLKWAESLVSCKMQKTKPLMKKVMISIQSVSGDVAIIVNAIDNIITTKTDPEYPCEK